MSMHTRTPRPPLLRSLKKAREKARYTAAHDALLLRLAAEGRKACSLDTEAYDALLEDEGVVVDDKPVTTALLSRYDVSGPQRRETRGGVRRYHRCLACPT
eukprot:TRINITY_DN3537_c0_g2_i2.p4 TRINITY_DN3537_c0_g2~~TRINITY_DN3537_c0_g2_i2.p4  ORF type:complete len:101 (-),score=13.48 TRINITY_DN3537_c0_g2_i2:395-697(-)